MNLITFVKCPSRQPPSCAAYFTIAAGPGSSSKGIQTNYPRSPNLYFISANLHNLAGLRLPIGRQEDILQDVVQ